MGFFDRKQKATTLARPPPPPQTTTIVPPMFHPPQPVWSEPPPYNLNQYAPQQSVYSNSPNQWAQAPQNYHNQFMSVDDFHAIQNALDQNAVVDQFSDIITRIDENPWNENEEDFAIIIEEPNNFSEPPIEISRAVVPTRNGREPRRSNKTRQQKITIWSKVSNYSNSRLPPELPPLRVYIPTWPLICLAAQYSSNAYRSPQNSQEKEVFVSADSRLGTKAMVMKSVPCDDKKMLVFAIRGTSVLSLRDWNVNLNTEPVSPAGFLDDEGNLCHAGFLRVAKAMIEPIALRLRTLLQENPSRANCSLLITGHSAGGAVAALLFTHMLSSIRSELSILTECFKRVHCVTFGAPPVSLLPLSKPDSPKYRKSLFFSFMNEGDPVVRAEKAYIRSLVDLISSCTPVTAQPNRKPIAAKNSSYSLIQNLSKLDLANQMSTCQITNSLLIQPMKSCITFGGQPPQKKIQQQQQHQAATPPPRQNGHTLRIWPVPQATLSNAGRLVLMRVPGPPSHQNPRKTSNSDLQRSTSIRWERDHLSRVTVHTVTDEQMRGVIFGDPTMHAMEVYVRRVEMLALKAVTART